MNSYILDAQHLLRDIGDGAETSTATETAIDFVAANADDFKAVFHVSALDTADANETYTLSVEVDAAAGFSSAVEVGSVTVTATGIYEIPLSASFVENLESGAIKMRAKATLGGTTPSITYGAYLVPVV